MKLIDAKVIPLKNQRGRKTGKFIARFADVSSPSCDTREAALESLSLLILARCQYSSTNVNVVSVRGHVGIFSYDTQGYVNTQHAWPDGHVSAICGAKDFREAEDSFRMHIAQMTWDGTLTEPDILPATSQDRFRSWAQFQLRYQYAIAHGMKEAEAHFYACDPRNKWEDSAA